MLVELSVMEQRYQAVLAVIQDVWRVTEVARRMGVSRQTVHSWIDTTKVASRPWPSALTDPVAVPTRSPQSSRLRSVSSGASIPGGVRGASSMSCARQK